MRTYVVNLETQFREESDSLFGRMLAAAACGFQYAEFWRWQELDLEALQAVVSQTRLAIESFVVDWTFPLTDPRNHTAHFRSWENALRLAERLQTKKLILALGDVNPRLNEEAHLEVICSFLRRIIPQAQGSGITLLLEPLNTVADHPGTWLDSTDKAFRIIDAVGLPALKLLFDVYHLSMSGESLPTILQTRAGEIGYVQFADAPGRGEPMTGAIDWSGVCALLSEAGYGSRIGLEFVPDGASEPSLRRAISLLDGLW